MIEAGQRLADFRRGYEFQDGEVIPDDYYDPTRNPGLISLMLLASLLSLPQDPKPKNRLKKNRRKTDFGSSRKTGGITKKQCAILLLSMLILRIDLKGVNL